MSRRALYRLTTTLLVTASLLFSQWALASYVCPMQSDGAAMLQMMEAGLPCEGMDEAQPVLCHQHAADAALSFTAAQLPDVGLPAIVQVLELPLVPDTVESAALPFAHSAPARPPPDPLFLATLRLRV